MLVLCVYHKLMGAGASELTSVPLKVDIFKPLLKEIECNQSNCHTKHRLGVNCEKLVSIFIVAMLKSL